MKIVKGVVANHVLKYFQTLPDVQPSRLQSKKGYGSDARIYLNNTDAIWNDIQDLIKQLCPDCTNPQRAAVAFERQYEPTILHVDPEPIINTIIIPLNDDPDVKTIAWKNQFETTKDFEDFIVAWGLPAEKQSSITEVELIDHCFDTNKEINIADYLDYDGSFSYVAGDVLIISGRQVHCSSDWRELNRYTYKDFAVIHTMP